MRKLHCIVLIIITLELYKFFHINLQQYELKFKELPNEIIFYYNFKY